MKTLLNIIMVMLMTGSIISQAQAQQTTSNASERLKKPVTDEQITRLNPVQVTAVAENDTYMALDSVTAMKTDTPILLTPATVNVITRQMLDDRQPRNFVDAIQTVPGMNQTSPRISTQNILSRGFSLRQAGGEFRNGLRHYENSNLAPEITNVERFEILKGPASVLYGVGGLGGVLNVVTKTPQISPAYTLEQSVGSYDYYRTALDITGPIDKEKVFSYRLNGHFEDTKSFQDFVNQETFLVSPSLAWRPTEKTSLVIDMEFLRADLHGNVHGLPADGTALSSPNGKIPINRSIMDPNFNRILREQTYVGYQFDHEFEDIFSFHSGFLYAKLDQPAFAESNGNGFVGGFTGPRRFVTRNAFKFDAPWESFALDNNLLSKFDTGPVSHELLVGFDLYRADAPGFGQSAPLPNLDLSNPVYGVQPTGPWVITTNSDSEQQWIGFYIQETFIPWESLRFVLAGRVTHVETDSENLLNQNLSRNSVDTALTPRFGVVYNPIRQVSLYATYSESFIPRTGTSFAGQSFVPEEGVLYEAGVKADLLDDKMAAYVAVFNMERSNVITADPSNPGFSVQTGKQRSQGVEFNLAGEPLPGWDINASMTWLDTAILQDNSFLTGQRLAGSPEYSANFWNTYTFQEGALKGFGGGFGIFYEGSRYGQLVTAATAAQAFSIPGYVRGDITVYYRQPHYELAVVINNVTDEEYFSGVLSRNLVYYGSPLSVTGSIKIKF
ncbi:TonB-dependent siderophore receptor [Oscillatoria laete-virens NRMC-F 0139]|nr:TonB-dependent siderophore receptor [Oscillatoria laete-virens]MDL5054769.1 TonB-dependent siderophore receptor [Oscillatoria laete-virens NRMC-F 0139]